MQDLKILNDFILKVQIQIVWSDMDVFGHVNNTKYFTYFETARVKYFEELGLLDYFTPNKLAGLISKNECSYFIPLSYPDTLTVGARVTDLCDEYIIMEHFIKSEQHGLSTIGESEIIFYSFESNKKIPVPQKVADQITKFEGTLLNVIK